jgi:hypothetical protein
MKKPGFRKSLKLAVKSVFKAARAPDESAASRAPEHERGAPSPAGAPRLQRQVSSGSQLLLKDELFAAAANSHSEFEEPHMVHATQHMPCELG